MVWPLLWALKGLNFAAKNAKGVALFTAFLLWIIGVIDTAITGVLSTVSGMLDKLNLSSFQQINMANIPYIGEINAIFPVSEFVALGTIFVTAWVLVIVIRWVKSFIPTIAN